jgi:hypothetical protein
LSGDIVEVIAILLKGTQITADDAKVLVASKPVQSFLNSKEFNEKLPGDLTYDTLVKAAKSDEMKILVSVAICNSFSIDDVKTILNSEIWTQYLMSSHVHSMLKTGKSLMDFMEFRDSEELKTLKLLAKGEKFSIEDAKSLVNSKTVQNFLASKQFKRKLPAHITVDKIKIFMDDEMINKIIAIAKQANYKPSSTLTAEEKQLIKESDEINKFLEKHRYFEPLLKNAEDLNKEDLKVLVESKEVQKIIVQKATKFLPKGFKKCSTAYYWGCEYDMQKLTDFQNSFVVRHLLPVYEMYQGGEAASQENMIAVFASKEFKSTLVKWWNLKTKYDIARNDASAFMESSQLKPFLPLLKDTTSLSSVDAVHMVKSMSFRDVILEQCVKLLPKNISVGDVKKFASSGTPELVLSLVKDPGSFSPQDAKKVLASKPVKDGIYEEIEKHLPEGMSIDDVKSFAEKESVKTLLPLLADPKKVTKEDLKNFLSKSEMKKIIFDKVSTVLPKAAKVEDFKKFMGSNAGKKLIHFVQGDVKDLDGRDVMDLFSYQFKYCKTEDECVPFSIKGFIIDQAQDYMPEGMDTKKAAEIFSSPQVQALLPLLKNPEDFSTEDMKNLLSNKDIKKALMDKVQEILPEGVDLSKAEEIFSSKEVQNFLPLLKNPKDLGPEDVTALLKNDKIKTMLFSQVEDYLPEGWSIAKIEKMLKSETSQALLPLLKDPSDFGVNDLKIVMKDKNIHNMIIDTVKQMLPDDVDLEQAEKIMKSDTVQSILPLLKNPEDFGVDDLRKIISSDKVKGMIYKKIQPLLPKGWDLKEAEKLLKSDAVKTLLSLMKDPDDFTADDAKALLMNKDIQAGLLEQVTKLFDQYFGEDAE